MPGITTISAEEVSEVAEFLAAFPGDKFSVPAWRERLRAWWELNPAFAEGVTARGWLLRGDAGKIVGIVGNIPLKFQQGECETTVHAGTTWRVVTTERGLGMTIKRRQMQEHRDALHFSTTPAPQVVALLKLLGYQPLARWREGGEQSVLGVNFRTLLGAKLGRFPFGKWAAALLAPLAGAWQALELRKLRAGSGLGVRLLESAGAAFDDLWARTRGRYAYTNVRTAAVIQWYCFVAPAGQKRLLGCFAGERLLGYLILLLEPEPGRLVARCVDLWTDPAGGDAIIAGLLAGARKAAAAAKCDQIVLPHFHPELAEAYARLGIPRRPAWPCRGYVAGPKAVLAGMTVTNTYFVEAQGDLGL